MGIDVDDAALQVSGNPESSHLRLPEATESGSELLHNMSQQNAGTEFSSAGVLRAIASLPSGPAHRALVVMGTKAEAVAEAAQEMHKQRHED